MKEKFRCLLIILGLLICGSFYLKAQVQEILYPELQGDTLLEHLALEYTPDQVLSYKAAREAMYTDIDNDNNSLAGIYTGYIISLDPHVPEPIAEALALDINCEHSYPQSKGASEEPARSNMHHLFPSKVNVNADRGSCPFNEIDDQSTQNWYRDDLIMHDIPMLDIDEYSEKDLSGSACGSFEPRENKKGDIARAQFYFYTIYRQEADQADDQFFHDQKETLLAWNYEDPVDSTEYERTWAIAAYQDGLPNPFVIDTSLARRAYFLPDMVLSEQYPQLEEMIRLFPNPVIENHVQIQLNIPQQMELRILDVWGNIIYKQPVDSKSTRFQFEMDHFPSGIYIFYFYMINKPEQSGGLRVIKI